MPDEIEPYDYEQVGRQVWHLRKGGMAWSDIADQHPEFTVDQLIKSYRSHEVRLASSLGTDERNHQRMMEIERLDALQAAVWPMAMAGDVNAGRQALAVVTTRAKLTGLDQLDGTDKNITNNILVAGGDTAAFIAALEEGRRRAELASAPPDDEED